MKILLLFMTVGLLHVYAAGTAQTVTLSGRNLPLERVLDAIRQQAGYEVAVERTQLRHAKPVTVQAEDMPLEAFLELVLRDQPLEAKVANKTIYLSKRKVDTPPSRPPVILNEREGSHKAKLVVSFPEVRGRVVDSTGVALSGASVRVLDAQGKRTSLQTSTDRNGEFVLRNVPEGTRLEISYIGYISSMINTATDIGTVLLRDLPSTLREVEVNAGYYIVKDRERTGSIGRVTKDEIENQPVSNPLSAIQGRISGLSIQQNTGVPGGGFTVRLRGQNSLRTNGNDLLYIVDGVPFPSRSIANSGTSFVVGGGNPLNLINLSDIESIEVLKDADATAIYGSLGANGVLLITTKKGKVGKNQFDVNFHWGWGNVASKMEMLNRREYLDMRREAFRNDLASPSFYDYDLEIWDTTRFTDWQKKLVGGTAGIMNSDVSLSGGNERTQFMIRGSFRKEGTVFPGDYDDQKGGMHLNLNHHSVNQKLAVGLTANFLNDKNNLIYTDLMGIALELAPVAPELFRSDGTLNWENSTWSNPLGFTRQRYIGKSNNLLSNLTISYQPTKHWQVKFNSGYTIMRVKESNLQPSSSFNPAWGVLGLASFSTVSHETWILEPQLHYKRSWGKFNSALLLGATQQKSIREGERINATNFANDAVLGNPMAAGSVSINDVVDNQYRYQALFGRVSLDWGRRYILNVTGRRDGSSRFGPGKQFGMFGSAGAAWIFSDEKWFTSKLISFGKLRMSYGVTGSDQIGDFGYLQLWSYAANSYDDIRVIQPVNLANADLHWESNRKFELGMEIGLWNDRLHGSISYYNNRSGNQLVGYTLPVTTGFTNVQSNLNAIVENVGWETEWSSINMKTNRFQWATSVNLSLPRNRLLNFPNLAASSYGRTYVIGESLSIQQSYQNLGVNPENGVYELVDSDEDNRISYPNDARIVRPMAARALFGMSNSFKYDRISLEFLIQGAVQSGYNYQRYFSMPGTAFNQPVYVLDRWQQQNDLSSVQKFSQNASSDAGRAYALRRSYGEDIVSDASYVRLKNLSVTYSIQDATIRRGNIQGWQLYLQGQNLITFTRYKGLDPETMTFRNIPPLRVIVVGTRITF